MFKKLGKKSKAIVGVIGGALASSSVYAQGTAAETLTQAATEEMAGMSASIVSIGTIVVGVAVSLAVLSIIVMAVKKR